MADAADDVAAAPPAEAEAEAEAPAEPEPVAAEPEQPEPEPEQQPEAPADGEEADQEQPATADEIEALKQALLTVINEKRAAAGAPLLQYDAVAGAAADAHCRAMGEGGFVSHWSLEGEKPYQRYHRAGCFDHVSENIVGYDAGVSAFGTAAADVQQQLVSAHDSFMSEEAPNDLNRRNVLDPQHTHIGLGVFVSEACFRYVEVYLDRYVSIDSPRELSANEIVITGEVLSPDVGPYACTVYYDAPPQPISAEAASDEYGTGYPDYSDDQVAIAWPWEMTFEDGRFSIPLSIGSLAAGTYYVHVYVRGDVDTIPYDDYVDGVSVPGDGTVCATGLVLTCAGDASEGGAGAVVSTSPELENSPEDEADSPGGAGADAADDALQQQQLPEEAEAVNVAAAEAVMEDPSPITQLAVAPGDHAPAGWEESTFGGAGEFVVAHKRAAEEASSIVDVTVTCGDEPPPEGFERLEGNLVAYVTKVHGQQLPPAPDIDTDELDAEEAEAAEAAALAAIPQQVNLCVRRGPTSDALVAVALVHGGEAFSMGHGYNTLKLPVLMPGEGRNMYLCYKRVGDGAEAAAASAEAYESSVLSADLPADVAGAAGAGADAAADEDEDEELTAEEAAEREALALAREERALAEAAAVEAETLRRQAEEELQQRIRDALAEKEQLLAVNQALQKRLAPVLSKKQDAQQVERKEEGANAAEMEKRYQEALTSVNDTRSELVRAQQNYDRIALELQTRLDEKELRASEIRDSFIEFKREIAKGAENSRTEKPIPRRVIAQFEEAEAQKDQEVEKMRLKNINLRNHLRKLENSLRAKEQLAEGLHLIDFEQLKIENQTLNEKIEERNEELHKLRKKTTTTVQVLTHIKEKLQFVQVENQVFKRQLADLDAELNRERDNLTRSKRERDELRHENARHIQGQGFVANEALVQDFEQRKIDIEATKTRLGELKSRHQFVTSQMRP